MKSNLRIDSRVRNLQTYLAEFEQGVFHIPSFQRDFLWEKEDIITLFDSIKNKYPIGSILFWKPIDLNFETKSIIGPYEIISNEKSAQIYILDGYQRLSTLLGCLTNPNKTNLRFIKEKWGNFKVYYDLDDENFKHLRSIPKSSQIPVYVFMNSGEYRKYTRKAFQNLDETTIELYNDRADELGFILNNFQMASIDIINATIEEAIEIFTRINEKGMPISKDWIVSALTNKGDFRLATEIDNLMEELKVFNFDESKRDVVFQCIQSSFGKIHFETNIKDLVKRADFIDVAKKSLNATKLAVKFLFEELLVLDSKLLPYNMQLVFLSAFFNVNFDKTLSINQIESLKRWFWITSYSNYFTYYSLSSQREAFNVFQEFIENEYLDPLYNNENDFQVGEFPAKLNMKSVRSKTLFLFMINYSQDFNKISIDEYKDFNIDKLFPFSADTIISNLIPLISTASNSIKYKKTKNRWFYVDSDSNYKYLFITHEMKKMKINSIWDFEKIWEARIKLIKETEELFLKGFKELKIQ